MLRIDESMANFDRVQLILSDAAVDYFLVADLRVKSPFSVVLIDWNRHWKVIVPNHHDGSVMVMGVLFDHHLFLCLFGKGESAILIHDWIFRAHQILTIGAKYFLQRSNVEACGGISQGIGCFFRGAKLLLLSSRRGRSFFLR